MRKKITQRILFLILIIFFIFFFIFVREKINYLFIKRTDIQPFVKINQDKITKIIFEDENKKIELNKKNNLWYVKKNNFEFKADEERIKKTIDALMNLKKEEIVSKNKNKYKDFGIDKRKITFYVDKNKFLVYIGDNANYNNNFVHIDGDDSVFLAENLNDVFSNDEWRDLKIPLILNIDKIESIEINYLNNDSKEKLVLTKEKNEWKINNKKAKKDRVDFFINDLSTLKANDIVYQENFSDVNPEIVIIINENHQIKKADLFSSSDQKYILKLYEKNVSTFRYVINSSSISSLLKKEEKDFTQ